MHTDRARLGRHKFRMAALLTGAAITAGGLAAIAPADASVVTAKSAKATPPVMAYVALGGTPTGYVAPLNTATDKIGKEIAAGNGPDLVWVSPNGKTVYAEDGAPAAAGGYDLVPISTATGKPGTPIALPSATIGPGPLIFTPNGKQAYVIDRGGVGGVTEINTTTGKTSAEITAGDDLESLAVTPNGATVYVAAGDSAAVYPINTKTNKPGSPIPVGNFPAGLLMSPNGKTLYVSNDDPPLGSVEAISTATGKVTATIATGSGAYEMALSPNGKTLYVTDTYGQSLTAISTATDKATATIPVCPAAASGLTCEPAGIVFTPNGKTAYIANQSREGTTLLALNTVTNAAKEITVGGSVPYLAITPNGSSVYAIVWYPAGGGAVVPIAAATGTAGTPIDASATAAPGWIAMGLPTLTVVTATLRAGVVGKAYSVQLAAAGGVGGYSWRIAAGKLPKGLLLTAAGLIKGKPKTKQTATFTVEVADPGGATAAAAVKIKVT